MIGLQPGNTAKIAKPEWARRTLSTRTFRPPKLRAADMRMCAAIGTS